MTIKLLTKPVFITPVMQYDIVTSIVTFFLSILIFSSLYYFQINVGNFVIGHSLGESFSFMIGHFLVVQVITYSQRQFIIHKFSHRFWSMYLLSSLVTLIWYFIVTCLNSYAIFYDQIKANDVWLITNLVINAGTIIGKYLFVILTLHIVSSFYLRKLLLKD